MRFITIIVFVLAYGPAIFDLAVTGRGVHRPTQTSTTDWALAQFYTSQIGKPSLAIPPTGLAGVAITSDHNNQDFKVDPTVSIWTTVHVTSRRALTNIGSFVNNFNGRRQWRYIRGLWRFNSGRVGGEGFIVYIYSLLFLAVISTIWRKRATEDLARFIGRQPLGAPTTCTGVVTVFEELRSGQEQGPGAPTVSSEIVSVSNADGSGSKGRNSRRIIVDTLLVFLGGFVIIHYEAVDDRAFWTITVILNPGPSSSSAVSRRVDNIYRVVPKRTVTLPTRGLIEAGPPVVRPGGEPLPSHEQVAQPNVAPKRRRGSASSFFTSIHSLEGVLVMACSSTSKGLHWSIQFYPFQHYHISHHTDNDHDKEELIQTDVDIPLPDSDDGNAGDEAEEEETEGNDLVEPALVPLPPSRPASPEAEEYIAALSRQYQNLRAMLVRPLLPGEARAIRAELRPRLRSLAERACERRGLPTLTSVTAMELEGQVNEQEIVEQAHEEEVGGQVHEVEVDGLVHEEADGQVNDEEADGRVNDEEADVSRKTKKPHRGGKKTRTRKHKHQTDKKEEADPAREH